MGLQFGGFEWIVWEWGRSGVVRLAGPGGLLDAPGGL